MHTKKVIIIDDEPIIVAGLENWLSRHYKTTSFESAESFLEAFDQLEFNDGIPTCILLDFQLPGINGVQLQASLKTMNNEFPIIFMSGNAQQKDIIDAWHGGGVDFILKPFIPNQITAALETQFRKMEDKSKLNPLSQQQSNFNIPISKREAEVLLLLGEGRQQVEVASILGISVRTIKMHRASLKAKLGLNTLAELGCYYVEYKQSIQKIIQTETLK
jgi:FixJ family two-component response regulator